MQERVPPAVQEVFQELKEAWEEIATTPVSMDEDTFERRIREAAERTGHSYDWDKRGGIEDAKQVLRNPDVSPRRKNLMYLEANPPELASAKDRYRRALGELFMLMPVKHVDAFVDGLEDEQPIHALYLRHRIVPGLKASAEAWRAHKES